jgi:hypothetical protein
MRSNTTQSRTFFYLQGSNTARPACSIGSTGNSAPLRVCICAEIWPCPLIQAEYRTTYFRQKKMYYYKKSVILFDDKRDKSRS